MCRASAEVGAVGGARGVRSVAGLFGDVALFLHDTLCSQPGVEEYNGKTVCVERPAATKPEHR